MATSGCMQRLLIPRVQHEEDDHSKNENFVVPNSFLSSALDAALPASPKSRPGSNESPQGVALDVLGPMPPNSTLLYPALLSPPINELPHDITQVGSHDRDHRSSQGSQHSRASVNNVSETSTPDSLLQRFSNVHMQEVPKEARIDAYSSQPATSSGSTVGDGQRQGQDDVRESSRARFPSLNNNMSRASIHHGGAGFGGSAHYSSNILQTNFMRGATVSSHNQPRPYGSGTGFGYFGYGRTSTCGGDTSSYTSTAGSSIYGSENGAFGHFQGHDYSGRGTSSGLALDGSNTASLSSFNFGAPSPSQVNNYASAAASAFDSLGGVQLYHVKDTCHTQIRATYDAKTQAQTIDHPTQVSHQSHNVAESTFNVNAAEFKHEGDAWNPSHLGKHVWLRSEEQPNWRQLLEPGVTADWNLIVNKIIEYNDQQASIFLQQKIKNSDETIKGDIIQSIVLRALELMGNRFGNFLIQRVFECANAAQIMGLAEAIRFNTVRLSTDAFGCHVIQKAFDCVPEHFKHVMVGELLNRISDTVTHRYACHVWQKLFELRWQGAPPMIMDTVNSALTGHWTSVALGETGSLVVQNIFENCNDQDKRPCINEVLGNLDVIARGQYGNWCIQHIVEHGSADDREHAIRMILVRAAEYSMDQYASKCIEKCLKVCGPDFLEGYLQQVLARRAGDNFSPLVQIARDQYGNFLVQWILGNAGSRLREVVDAELRKHLVSLRGNKYGSKVALSCGYGPQGVRPGVPFASSHHRQHFSGLRGSSPYQNLPNHSAAFAQNRKYGQIVRSSGATYYGPRSSFDSACNPPQGPYGQHRY